MQFSKKLDRIIKKSGLLTAHEQLVEAYNPDAQTDVTINFEKLIRLFQTIEQSFEAQDKKVEQAERSLELSSTELAESNKNLFAMNLTVNAILNNLDQGLVVFDQAGQCSKFASKAAQKHFNLNFETNDVPVTQLFSNQDAESIKDWVSILFDQNFDFNNIAVLGPTSMTNSENRLLEIDYRPITDNDNKITKVIAISKDITEKVAAQKEAERQKNAAKTIFEIMQSPHGFIELFNTVQTLNKELSYLAKVPQEKWTDEEDNSCKRILHSIKGGVGNYYLYDVVNEIHHLEEHYLDISEFDEKVSFINSCLPKIDQMMSEVKEKYKTVLEKLISQSESESAGPAPKFVQFYSELSKQLSKDNQLVKQYASEFLLKDFKTLFANYEQTSLSLARSLEKDLLPFEFKGDQIPVNRDAYKDLLANFVHVFRNICDHGIETQAERLEKGKNPKGRVSIETKLLDKSKLKFTVQDDGNGINCDKLRQKISGTPLEQKYSGKPDSEVINVIFEAGFSTKDVVTDLSGRGVGMESVKHCIEKLGGTIKVTSEPQQGTQLEIVIPVLNDFNLTGSKSQLTAA